MIAADGKRLGRLASRVFVPSIVVASAYGANVYPSSPIRWDLALVHGLQVTAESLGIQERIRVVTLSTSGCTPRSATLLTLNPESGAQVEIDIPVQGRAVQFEVEEVARPDALLKIECQEREDDGGPPRTFTLALDPQKAR